MTMWGPFHPFQTHLRTRNNQPWSVALLFDSPEKSHGAPQPTQHLPPPCLFFVVGVCVPLFFSVLSGGGTRFPSEARRCSTRFDRSGRDGGVARAPRSICGFSTTHPSRPEVVGVVVGGGDVW